MYRVNSPLAEMKNENIKDVKKLGNNNNARSPFYCDDR